MSERADIGFGRASLVGTYQAGTRLADEIDVRVFLARRGAVAAALAVADFGLLWPATCQRLRRALAESLGMPPECVGVFATQNHGVNSNDCKGLDADALERAFVSAARAAAEGLQPAQAATACVRPDPPLAVCRRIHLEGFGAFTFWFGYRLDEPGRADVSHILKLALRGMVQGRLYPRRFFEPAGPGVAAFDVPDAPLPVPSPLYLPAAADELLQAVFFRGLDGRPIGSLVRFAAHPATANVRDADWHSGDYPVYVRRGLEEGFGGSAVFLTGPCGDQAPLIDRKGLHQAQGLGARLADAALAALRGAQWTDAAPVHAASPSVQLRVRQDYPCCPETAAKLRGSLESQFRAALAEQRPLAELKRILDQWEMYLYVAQGNHRDWTGLELTGQGGLPVSHPLFVMRVGPAVIAGLPGEPFGGISKRLRDETIGESLIVCEEANGYLSYIPTAREYPLGGYGPNAAIFDGACEDSLVAAIRSALREAD